MKEVDNNGFWRVRNNPLSKEGVFPYLGKQISAELEPNKIYKVYRPMSEISAPETIESFDGIPLIDEHEMIGEGWTDYDDRPAGGVVYHTYAKDGKLFGDIRIFSEQLKDEIKNGKKELSMGYSCRYEPEQGVFDGEYYDFVQRDLRGNHVALVNRGRMGSDVRVYDQKITFDTLEGLVFDYREDQERGDDGKWILSISTKNIMGDKTEEQYRQEMMDKLFSLRGDKVFNKSLNAEIEIRMSALRKYKSLIGDLDKVHLVPYLRNLLQHAKFGKPEDSYTKETEANIKGYFKANPKFLIDGNEKFANFTVRQDDKGHFFWDLQVRQSSQHATPATNQGDTGAYDCNIAQDTLNVNIYFGEESMENTTQDEKIPSQDGDPKESGVDCSLNQQGKDSMEKVDKRKDISEVEAMLYEAKKDPAKLTDELIKTVLSKMENNSYNASEKGKATDEEAKEDKSEDEAKTCKDCKAKDECEPKKDSTDEAKADVKGEAPTEEKKDKEKDKKEDTKAEDSKPALDALPEILARLESIENSLKRRNENKSDIIFGLDETPVKSNEMDKGLMKYLGE